MWGVLWGLWAAGKETRIIPELNFSHATDRMERVNQCPIFHNAGISSDFYKIDDNRNYPCFYKGKYHRGNIDPTKDPHLDVILNNEESKKHGTWYYVSKLDELRNKYNLNY